MKNQTLNVQGLTIAVSQVNNQDYISLTDMVANLEDGSKIIEKWITNKGTLEFLAAWEGMHNPEFNSPEFRGIRSQAGSNSFTMSVKRWVQSTGAVGIFAKSGRYGGTYAHKDIAFEFGSYVNPVFKLYLIKEFQRLKDQQVDANGLEWNVRRILTKANYKLHTSAVKEHVLPKLDVDKDHEWLVYATEADILNKALYGFTAKQWREENSEAHKQGKNVRDVSSIIQLAVLSNLETISAVLIQQGLTKEQRYEELRKLAAHQLRALSTVNYLGENSDDQTVISE